uniref:Uncharacterized protein n=1 Tax=Panagrolaimus sp. PS1159 TaxID=55785 RepID=A0AC35GLM6_9BILA
MSSFDKPIKFKNFQSSSSDYHLRMYKTRDEDNMHIIELRDDTNLEFIYRFRLTTEELDNIRRELNSDCRENEINPKRFDVIKYIQEFVLQLSEEKWLTCETNAEGCNINFYGIYNDLGHRFIRNVLKLSLLSVKDKEFHQYVMKRYNDKKRENEAYEKKIRQLEAEVEETKNMRRELKVANEKIESLDFRFKRLEVDYEREREEVAELLEDKKDFKREFEDLKREYDITENEADELVKERDTLKAEIEDLQEENDELEDKCMTMTEAINKIADKGRKYETTIKELDEENQKLVHQLKEYKKSLKKISKQNDEIIKESSLKD